jgi:hypothetical protein
VQPRPTPTIRDRPRFPQLTKKPKEAYAYWSILGRRFLVSRWIAHRRKAVFHDLSNCHHGGYGALSAVWLAIAAVNMWLGVAKAGYSVSVEFPIFALIFAVPAAAAVLVRWRFL